ncbi:hypothetical protein LEP1GSC071_2428 [Leptospira santarosai str. JET]|uniref:Uncharacterized protein n=1 Tax=Leptospira santarosai serovar Shermani str. LT 821 TaxID=758847 RepID=K8Y303_9LEPT|nr:hypothetical protein LEP1GSC071_2428 [Leptospira santarosai str. JET]EKT87978.1 hypothetical protein LSS_05041 [Leptospira santarosai serovar Shermani str. LT 821]EPG81039.1 hypothetical protein LEP1GSC048_2333 [Leptospira santarosai serovar Shermani str. 1342KT]
MKNSRNKEFSYQTKVAIPTNFLKTIFRKNLDTEISTIFFTIVFAAYKQN